MKIKYFQYGKDELKMVFTNKGYKIGNACECGCSKHPFLVMCDGKNNYMNLIFESVKELNEFKKKVSTLMI